MSNAADAKIGSAGTKEKSDSSYLYCHHSFCLYKNRVKAWVCYFPEKFALRFSTNAAMPSF